MINNVGQFEHIYLHWPFCKNRCHYCDFIALAKHEEFHKSYHQALIKEIDLIAQKSPQKQKLKTIFIGGGTPSLYPINLLEELFETLERNFDLNEVQEITIEANPIDISKEKLQSWSQCGINRLSLGVQILDDKILQKLNRQQTLNDTLNAIELAPSYFKNISIDLILGLPDATKQLWDDTLNQVTSWPISHISIYFLTIYEKTPLYFKLEKNEIQLTDEDTLVDIYKQTVNFLKQKNFLQYEISNFAKPTHESIHNQAYWNRKAYYGFGLGASSFINGKERLTNINNIETYIQSTLTFNKIPTASHECLNQQQIILEILMLSLRQTKGLDLHDVVYLLTDVQKNVLHENVELLKSESLLQQKDDTIFLPLNSMILENNIILRLIKGLF